MADGARLRMWNTARICRRCGTRTATLTRSACPVSREFYTCVQHNANQSGWSDMAADCRVVYVECCYGLLVRPAHGCKWLPVCVCGWLGTEYHPSQLQARQEGTAHVNGEEYTPPWARTSTRASFVLSGRETPAGYARTAQVQALVDKLRALRDARLEVSGTWEDGQTDTVVVTMV